MPETIIRLDAEQLKLFLLGGSSHLGAHKEEVNALNVFPVPDGDTGINMYLTVSSAGKKIGLFDTALGVGKLSADFSMGTLMGARGNSGVILSQIFRGFSLAVQGKQDINAQEFAAALQRGSDLSYKSVLKPVEGTMLTVYRLLAAAAVQQAAQDTDIVSVLKTALLAGEEALKDTPNLLPVLREAGVVDAGGKGLLLFIEGGLRALTQGGIAPADSRPPTLSAEAVAEDKPRIADSAASIEFTFCTQLLIMGEDMPIDAIREHLSQTPPGDSLLVVGDENLIKIHFHNNQPWQVLEYCSRFGTLHDIIIDNMLDQHHETLAQQEAAAERADAQAPPAAAPEKAPLSGVIAVCAGEGMAEIYADLGATVISGGQTMNPSAEDLLLAVEQNPAQELVLLPNNSNIILTADQVKSLAKKKVAVVKSKYITQGLAAMLKFNPEQGAEENSREMSAALDSVINGELTYAVRDTKYNGFQIKANDLLALMQGEISGCGQDMEAVLLKLVEDMVAAHGEAEIISMFWGSGIGAEQAAAFAAQVEERFPGCEVELHQGGQPLYYFLLSVE